MNNITTPCRWGSRRTTRHGAVLIIVIICLLLVSLIGASLARLSVAELRQSYRERLRLQAIWLAESALDRAAAQLNLDTSYQGEIWQPQLTLSEHQQAGKVVIRIVEAQGGGHTAMVTAEFPAGVSDRARISRQINIK